MPDRDGDEMLEGVGNPAREKTLGERAVSDRDIREIHEDIENLNDDLADLKKRGEDTF